MNNKKFVTTLVVIALTSVLILVANPVSACYYTVGTYESDYTTQKNSFFKGETVYGKGYEYGYSYPLKLRINDPNGNIVYYSDQSTSSVYGSFFLNETAPVGTWSIQLGVYHCNKWQWSTSSGRIAYFSVNDANFTLTVNVDGNGDVAVDPDLNYYSFGTSVNLNADPEPGWTFSYWSGDISSSNNPENIIMNCNKSVTAHFIQNQYILNVSTIGNGTVIKEPDQSFYYYGDVVNLTCLPELGWAFDHWEGSISGNENPTFVIIDEDKYITAVFTESLYTLTVNIVGDGAVDVNPIGPYYFGEIVSLNASANIGSTFSNWSGDLESNSNPTTITMDSDKTVTATFTINYYILTINIVGNGIVIKDPEQSVYSFGTIVNLTALPETGWVFDHWSGDLIGNSNQTEINLTEDKNVTAYFALSNAGGGGSNGGGGGDGGSTRKPNKLPIADLSAGEPYVGFVDEIIEFNGSLSYDTDGQIVKYEWTFGDGMTGFGEITTHTYSSPGDYEVKLKVTDDRDGSDTDESVAVIVIPNHPPSVPVIIGPSEGLTNINYSFSVFSTDEDLDDIKYTINWGDGNTTMSDYMPSGVLFNTTHMWSKSGEYKIVVKADDGQTTSTGEKTIIIKDPKPVPKSDNFILIILGLLALMILILFLLLAKRKKDEDEEENKNKKKKKKKK